MKHHIYCQRLVLLCVLCLSLLVAGQPVYAAGGSGDAESLLHCKLDAVLTLLQSQNLEKQAKKKSVLEIIAPLFDFPLMAKLTLGREHWPGLDGERQARFIDLFTGHLKDFYIEKLTLYSNEKILFKEAVQERNKISIPTEVIATNNTIAIVYKFYQSGDVWKIYDVEIENVSIISIYRSQFKEILNKGTVDDLLHQMETPRGATESPR